MIGEIYLGADANPLNRLNEFYNKGYAGVWGWSLFPEKTADNLPVVLSAAQQFTAAHNDVGPKAQASSPSPSPNKPGDIVAPFGKVDIFDYSQLLSDYGKTGTNLISDIEKFGSSLNKVDIFDYSLLLSNFGK